MAFPINPVDQQIFTNPLGTAYKYDSTRTAWLIMSQTLVGPQGDTGFQGITGLIGGTGVVGLEGQTGIQGITGLIGDTGFQGVTGFYGETGVQGIQGVSGDIGQMGDTGLVGVTGLIGDTGIQGYAGATGIEGEIGVPGSDGATGIQGVTGILGIDGQTGIMGVDGVTGLQGVTGILGIDGQTGIMGVDGVTGIQGITGFYGLTGLQGPGGTGITNYVTKFIDGTGGVIGSSIIYDSGSRIGIGTTSPGGLLHISGVEYGAYLSGLLIDNDNDTTGSEVGIDFNVSSNDTTAGDVARVSAIRTGVGPTGDLIISTTNSGSLTEKMRVTSSGLVGIGTIVPDSKVTIAANSLGLQAPGVTGVVLHVSGDNSSTSRILVDAFSNGNSVPAVLMLRNARGTVSSPIAVQSGDQMGLIAAYGYGTTAYSGARTAIQFFSSETWTDTSQGTSIAFLTTPIGKSSAVRAMTIDNTGNIGIGISSPTSLLHVKADVGRHAQMRLERSAFNRQSTVAFIPHTAASPVNPQWNVGFLASDSSVTFSYYDGTGGGNLLTVDTAGVSVGNMPVPGYVMNDAFGRLVGGNSIPTVVRSFVQGNTFVIGDVLRLDSTGGWALAQADTPFNAEALGVVSSATATDFTMVFEGYISNLDSLGLSANTVYFLSADNTGKLTPYDPNIANPVLVSKPMLETATATTGYVVSVRGIYGDPSALGTFPYRTVTSDYTVGITDYSIFADSSHVPRNIQLPNASTVPGKIYNVKKIDPEVYSISVFPFGSQKIDNASVQVIASPFSCITVQSDGSNWWII